uniref:Uncharacterized protein LOC111126717 n=1 Tax=Crassostrea virginica TaxID=6565 RepID=A0A8B8DH98_CRAVI|nr:uncharacterized protein LOC111126717 [Crassostrea virginica]
MWDNPSPWFNHPLVFNPSSTQLNSYEDPWPSVPGPAEDNNGTTPPGSLLREIHPLPHTDLAVRTLPNVRRISSHLPDRSTGAPARLHDHLPPGPAPFKRNFQWSPVVSQTNPHPLAMTGNLAFHGRFP